MNLYSRLIPSVAAIAVMAPSTLAQQTYPHYAETQDVGFYVYLVRNKDEFLKAWAGSTPPQIHYLSEAKIGDKFALAVIFWGGAVNDSGNCHITMNLLITATGNVKVGEGKGIPVCMNRSPPPAGQLGNGDILVDLSASGDPTTLRITTDFIDHVSGDKLTVTIPLPVSK